MTGIRHTLVVLLLAAIACGAAAQKGASYSAGRAAADNVPAVDLSILASIGLDPGITDVAEAFQRKTGNRVHITFADSPSVYSRIRNGAEFDALFSADANDVSKLAASGAAIAGSVTEYARDQLMLCISPMVPVEISPRDPMAALRNKIVSHIAIADPEHTELGKVTVEALTHGGAYDVTVRRKILIANDVSELMQLLQSGTADVAILPMSATRAYGLRGARVIPIAPNLYRPIRMEAAVVTRSKHHREALELLKFAASPNGHAIFRRYGFYEPQRTAVTKH